MAWTVGKTISGLAGSATRAGIRYGFVHAHNMGDLTAKEGSQVITASLLGTAIGLLLSPSLPVNSVGITLSFCLAISGCALFSVYHSLRFVALPTLNYQVGDGERIHS